MRKYSHFTHWVFSGQIGGYFLNVPTPYPLGVVRANWWVLLKSTQNVPARYVWSKSPGSFTKNSLYLAGSLRANWWVKWGQIVSELTMNSHRTCRVSDPLPPVYVWLMCLALENQPTGSQLGTLPTDKPCVSTVKNWSRNLPVTVLAGHRDIVLDSVLNGGGDEDE